MEKLPTKISPCPILEATVELKFSSNLPKGAIFGIAYSAIHQDFDKHIEQLPTAMIPNEVVEADPSLKYKPLYKLSKNNFSAQIGYDVISYHNAIQYVGWQQFFKKSMDFFQKIISTNIIDNSKNISFALRYLNFFSYNIFPHINFDITLMNKEHNSDNLVFRTEIPDKEFVKILQIANNVTIQDIHNSKQGSLLDITCFTDIDLLKLGNTLETAHILEKELFFGLIKDELLQNLSPEY